MRLHKNVWEMRRKAKTVMCLAITDISKDVQRKTGIWHHLVVASNRLTMCVPPQHLKEATFSEMLLLALATSGPEKYKRSLRNLHLSVQLYNF